VVEEFLVARDVSYRYATRRGVEPVPVLRRFSLSLMEGEFNLKTTKALGLTIPDKLLALADEVIE
jgi:hypothetical protein